jgi:ferric-dicitrate binding protein FerR (iron transport regulator)
MSEKDRPAPDDAELARLFAQAAVRPRPRAKSEAAAFDALRGEWQQVVRQRRQRRVAPLAVAASVLLAIAAVIGLTTRSAGIDPGAAVAAIARAEGTEITWRDENTQTQPLASTVDLRIGQRLSTGAGSRVALAWHGGGSLRMDEHTRIEFVSARSVRLVAGSVYFGSAAPGQSAGAALSIQTPAGEVLHVGTQFMMRVDGDEVELSVREGQVRVTGDGFELVVRPGEQLDLDPGGLRSRRSIESYDETWSWTQAIAPRERLEGRTAFEILAWAARETGRHIDYAPGAEALARQTIVRGLDERTPEDALRILPLFTDLEYEVRADAIVLRAR